MDGISATSSVFAVASLGIQFIESTIKIHDFSNTAKMLSIGWVILSPILLYYKLRSEIL
jgi:hypothetical protein